MDKKITIIDSAPTKETADEKTTGKKTPVEKTSGKKAPGKKAPGKKTPMRKCTGCNEMKPKKELIRIVRGEDEGYSIDLTGKKNGRGAYICRKVECFEKARKSKGFERSFKHSIPKEVYESIREELAMIEA